MMYAKVVVRMGVRTECKNCDFSDILEDEDVSNEELVQIGFLSCLLSYGTRMRLETGIR